MMIYILAALSLSLFSSPLPKGPQPPPVIGPAVVSSTSSLECQSVAFAEPRLSLYGKKSFFLSKTQDEHTIFELSKNTLRKLISFKSQDHPAFGRVAEDQFLLFRQNGCTSVDTAVEWVSTKESASAKEKQASPLGRLRALKVYTQGAYDAAYDVDRKELITFNPPSYERELLFRSEKPVLFWNPSQSLASVLTKPRYIENYFKTLSGKRSHRQLSPTEKIDIRARGMILSQIQGNKVTLQNRGKKVFANAFPVGTDVSAMQNDFDGRYFLSYSHLVLRVSSESSKEIIEYTVKASDSFHIALAWLWDGGIFIVLEDKQSSDLAHVLTWSEKQWKKTEYASQQEAGTLSL
jgi:hypothetical protein